jgi:hypothetical protein
MNQQDGAPAQAWATREQLAVRYQVHPRTVDDWRRRGILPAFIVSSRLVRFPVAECDEGLRRFRHTARWEQKEGGAL